MISLVMNDIKIKFPTYDHCHGMKLGLLSTEESVVVGFTLYEMVL